MLGSEVLYIIWWSADNCVLQVLEAAKHLHLKEHTVLDGSGNVFKLAAPVECKGIVGSDDRWLISWVGLSLIKENFDVASQVCWIFPFVVSVIYFYNGIFNFCLNYYWLWKSLFGFKKLFHNLVLLSKIDILSFKSILCLYRTLMIVFGMLQLTCLMIYE